jgi:hypothetical protein
MIQWSLGGVFSVKMTRMEPLVVRNESSSFINSPSPTLLRLLRPNEIVPSK